MVDEEGAFVQHEAVVPHAPRELPTEARSVVLDAELGPATVDHEVTDVTARTQAGLSAWAKTGHFIVYIEHNRLTLLTVVVGLLLLLLAAVLVART